MAVLYFFERLWCFMTSCSYEDIYDAKEYTFVLTETDQQAPLGMYSLHFYTNGSFVGYWDPFYNTNYLLDGSRIPVEALFENESFDPETRIFQGEINWGENSYGESFK